MEIKLEQINEFQSSRKARSRSSAVLKNVRMATPHLSKATNMQRAPRKQVKNYILYGSGNSDRRKSDKILNLYTIKILFYNSGCAH
jgi:hypothetical protein